MELAEIPHESQLPIEHAAKHAMNTLSTTKNPVEYLADKTHVLAHWFKKSCSIEFRDEISAVTNLEKWVRALVAVAKNTVDAKPRSAILALFSNILGTERIKTAVGSSANTLILDALTLRSTSRRIDTNALSSPDVIYALRMIPRLSKAARYKLLLQFEQASGGRWAAILHTIIDKNFVKTPRNSGITAMVALLSIVTLPVGTAYELIDPGDRCLANLRSRCISSLLGAGMVPLMTKATKRMLEYAEQNHNPVDPEQTVPGTYEPPLILQGMIALSEQTNANASVYQSIEKEVEGENDLFDVLLRLLEVSPLRVTRGAVLHVLSKLAEGLSAPRHKTRFLGSKLPQLITAEVTPGEAEWNAGATDPRKVVTNSDASLGAVYYFFFTLGANGIQRLAEEGAIEAVLGRLNLVVDKMQAAMVALRPEDFSVRVMLQKTLIHAVYLGLTFLRRAAMQSAALTERVIKAGTPQFLETLKTAFRTHAAFQQEINEIQAEAENGICSLNPSLYRTVLFDEKNKVNTTTQQKRKRQSDDLASDREAKLGKRVDLPSLDELLCPITGELFIDPVVAADGHTYERLAFARWMNERQVSPLTNLPLKSTNVVPNTALKKLVEAYEPAIHAFAMELAG